MSRYSDHVRDEYGRTVPGVSIYVYKWDADADAAGDLETLTDDLAAPLANPLTSDADGLFYFNSVDGQKLIEYHFGGKVEFRDLILVGDLPVPQAVFGGLLVNAPALTIPTGMDMIGTDGADALDHGGANYVAGTAPTARSGFTSANTRNFVLSKEQVITPQMFYQATDPDAQNMMQAAADYLHTFSYNPSPGGYYTGAPTLMCPAGPVYNMHAPIDFLHSSKVVGEGDGQFGPGSGGATHFKWTDGTSGFRVQGADTSGETTVDSPIHRGAAGMYFADMCLEGGFGGTTESDHHGLVIRTALHAERMWIKNWPGEGVHCWAGTINGGSPVGGNNSTTYLTRVKTEGNRGGIDIRGGDSNVITTINCQGYQNRWFGLLDDDGAGSNTHIGMHCASNGVVFGTWAQTQCSYAGNYYAAVWGGNPTIAPSGTTADTANWYYIGAGAPLANLIPAWVNTPGTFRAGGEYLTLNTAGVLLENCYSETGGFSQFSNNTIILHGTILAQYYRGGSQIGPSGLGDGIATKAWGNSHHYFDTGGSQAGLQIRDLSTGASLAFLLFLRGDSWWLNNGLNIQSGALRFGTTTAIDASRNATLAAVTNTSLASTGAVTSSSATAGVGYATGAGGTVTQATNKSTGVTLNKVSGQITMNNAALASAAKVSFVVTNSAVGATDLVSANVASGGTANAYRAAVTAVAAGSFTITVENITAGSLSEAPVISFAVIKAVAA